MPYASLRDITEAGDWRQVAEAVVGGAPQPSLLRVHFETYWIEAGHRVREQVADDRLLCQMLRRLTPPYHGAGQTLYRGENTDRWRVGNLGFSWTTAIAIARMFGSGLNAVHSGGVLLSARFPPEAIISAPVPHSVYLQEHQYTVDPTLAEGLQVVERYPPA